MNPEIKFGLMVRAVGAGELRGECSTCVGTVDHLDQGAILVTLADGRDGPRRWMPLAWVTLVASVTVYLDRDTTACWSGVTEHRPQLSA